MLKSFLAHRLFYWYDLISKLKKYKIQIIYHPTELEDESSYCDKCDIETYNIIFAQKPENDTDESRHVPHCLDCALRIQISADVQQRSEYNSLLDMPFSQHKFDKFAILQQHSMEEMQNAYDKFKLMT